MRVQKFDPVAGLLVDTAPDAMIVVDAEGTIMLMNARSERLFGYDRSELMGKKVEFLVPQAARVRHVKHRARFFNDPASGPTGGSMQFSARRKDATEFPAEISLSTFDVDGEVVVSVTVRDVTDRMAEAEAHRELATRAERDRLQLRLDRARRMETLRQLAGSVAHDFDNILAVILTYASFVEDRIDKVEQGPNGPSGGKWTSTHHDIVEVRNAAERAIRLTHQLLTFARKDVNRPDVVDLPEALDALEPMLQRILGDRVNLVINSQLGAPPVRIDRSQIEQVLFNLIVNARDAMPAGGRVIVEINRLDANVAIATGQPEIKAGITYLALRVTDTGSRIPADVVDRIFEPFVSTNSETSGTGLGLATVYGIVTQAGGSVEVSSDEDRGTTFTILLPAVETRATTAQPEIVCPSRPAGGATILVVDDDGGIRDVAQQVLLGAGYDVLLAKNGDEALATLTRHDGPIHLLLSEMVMPGLQGHELAAAAALVRPATKVILMSDYPEPLAGEDLATHLRLLDKPFTRTALLDAIHAVERP